MSFVTNMTLATGSDSSVEESHTTTAYLRSVQLSIRQLLSNFESCLTEVEPSQGGRPSSPSRKPTSALDLNECSTGIVKQSLLLNIQASVLMMIIYRPFIESADGQVAKAEIAEKECIK